MSSSPPVGPSAPAGPTGAGGAPDARDGSAARPDGAPDSSPQPYGAIPYPSTPYGQLPPPGTPPPGTPPLGTPPPGGPPLGSPPPAAASAHAEPPRGSRGRTRAGMLAVAVVAAVVGGGVGGYVGHQAAVPTNSAASTLNQPVPAAGDLPADPISTVASNVLPSVVQLAGSGGEGSGVVLSSDGLILTNAHVLSAARNGQLTATFQNGSTAPVEVVGRDTRADLAVVRARSASGLTPIRLGNSDSLRVGQQVVAVGSPLGLAGTVTSGIVSAINRPVETGGEPDPSRGGLAGLAPAAPSSVLDAIQTDAAINPGNSGGPLVDMQGRIVGITSAIASLGSGGGGQSGSIGLGFAIPINQAKRIADELVATGRATQAQLGVSVRDANPTGAQLVDVQAGSAAAKAGLQPGDVVSKIGNRLVDSSDQLVAAVNSAAPGSNVTLTVSSGGAAPRTVPVTLGSVTVD